MFAKIRKYFSDLMTHVIRILELSAFARKDLSKIDREFEKFMFTQIAHNRNFNEKLDSMGKTLSSIELEMLMSRGACLDNNFDGKQDM